MGDVLATWSVKEYKASTCFLFVIDMTARPRNLPAEERETGVPRQWIEQVLPRPGKRHPGPVTVRVGRWTGSMGEGLAIGLHAVVGAEVIGTPMAKLLGALGEVRLLDRRMGAVQDNGSVHR